MSYTPFGGDTLGHTASKGDIYYPGIGKMLYVATAGSDFYDLMLKRAGRDRVFTTIQAAVDYIVHVNATDNTGNLYYGNHVVVLGPELAALTEAVEVPLEASGTRFIGTPDTYITTAADINLFEVAAYRVSFENFMVYTSKSSHTAAAFFMGAFTAGHTNAYGHSVTCSAPPQWSTIANILATDHSQPLAMFVDSSDVEYMTVRNCTIEGTSGNAIDVAGGTNNSYTCYVKDNFFKDCEKALAVSGGETHEWVVANNVSVNDTDAKGIFDIATGTNADWTFVRNLISNVAAQTDSHAISASANSTTTNLIENYASNRANGGSGGTLITEALIDGA